MHEPPRERRKKAVRLAFNFAMKAFWWRIRLILRSKRTGKFRLNPWLGQPVPGAFTLHAGPVHLAHSCELFTKHTERGMANRGSPEYTPWRRTPFQVWKRLHSIAGAWALEPRTPDRVQTEVWTPWQSCTRDAQLAKTHYLSHGYLIVLGVEGWGEREGERIFEYFSFSLIEEGSYSRKYGIRCLHTLFKSTWNVSFTGFCRMTYSLPSLYK